jgi:hypothetical protein
MYYTSSSSIPIASWSIWSLARSCLLKAGYIAWSSPSYLEGWGWECLTLRLASETPLSIPNGGVSVDAGVAPPVSSYLLCNCCRASKIWAFIICYAQCCSITHSCVRDLFLAFWGWDGPPLYPMVLLGVKAPSWVLKPSIAKDLRLHLIADD